MEIKKYPDPILKQKAEAIKDVGPAVFELIRQMKETINQEQEGGVKGVGLAAPQVGISQRVIVIVSQGNPRAYINPEIVSKSSQKEKDKEGCLSLPGLWLDIKRAKTVKVRALDENGKPIEFEVNGFLARVFQHEIDHLNAVLFYERLNFWQRLKIKRKLDKHEFN